MVKPKKPEIGVWKTIETKGCKHQKEKPKPNEKLPANSRRQKIVNDASWSKNSKCPKSSPKEKFHNENRQWSNSHKSMSFPPYGSSMPMPWEPYFNMHYICPSWYYSSYMPSPSYFCQTHRELVINEPSPMCNDRFNHKNRSTQKNKRKVIKQVYRVKKDGRLNKNSDLTLDIKKATIEKSSASSNDQIVPNNEHVINNIVEQRSCSAGGQHDLKMAVSQSTGLTGVLTSLTGLARKSGRAESIPPNSKVMRKKPSFDELLHKYQKIAEQKQNNRLGDQRWNSSSPKTKKHQRTSHWSSSFIPSMHVPWNACSGIPNSNPWFWYNPWSSLYNYQYYACDASRSYGWPLWPHQDFNY
jgi:hypothetical protein